MRAVPLHRHAMLARIPPEEQASLEPYLRPALLETKRELAEVGALARTLYFPLDCAISLLNVQDSGRMVEVAVVGSEGCSPAHLFPNVAMARTVVQVGGMALQIDISTLQALWLRMPVFQAMMSRLGALLFRGAVISVGCSQYHAVEQRLGRWLLAHVHRTGLRQFPFTHEFLADLLGVLRVTVTEALGALQRKGLVQYSYGKVEVTDVGGLEVVSCDCFPLMRHAIAEYLRDLDLCVMQPPVPHLIE